MPHSLYLGSGIVQPRLYHYDLRHGHVSAPQIPSSPSAVSLESTTETTLITTLPNNTADSTTPISLQTATRKQSTAIYRPTLSAIKSCLSYSIAELTLSLFTFALFVNSAILIIAGASLSSPSTSDSAASASLFDIHALLSTSLSPAAGTIFALALLLSGTSAGIVCTIAGQMVSEGQLNWSVKPWVRRLITRSVSITPSIIIAGAVGKEGLSSALEASQVALSVILPVVSAPLIWFTMRKGIMTVRGVEKVEDVAASGNEAALNKDTDAAVTSGAQAGQAVTPSPSPLQTPRKDVDMANNWFTSACAIAIWLLIVVMNVASWVLTGKQQGG
jgi:metal iron transporter